MSVTPNQVEKHLFAYSIRSAIMAPITMQPKMDLQPPSGFVMNMLNGRFTHARNLHEQ